MSTVFFAPAKVNLALHVTGQRDDGYHLIETLVVFADIGDRVSVTSSLRDSFEIVGPRASALAYEDPAENLVIGARDLLRHELESVGRASTPVSIVLEKHLPTGSGMGGGSADAAATLKALAQLWTGDDLSANLNEASVTLGADVPMCLLGRPLIATGIGERVKPLALLPAFAMVLVNPGVHSSTPTVFKALKTRTNAPLSLKHMPSSTDTPEWIAWLQANTRNDLQTPANDLTPKITDVIDAIEATEPLLTRMTGSGATCFGIFKNRAEADLAAHRLLRVHPDWWITAATTAASPQKENP
ncbi:4-(cytidine 5'-diphospho)-2-C-methyl-D-erythritol kinase [Oricola cellulosilytica]|uniref:4-diphosphocytidyl-2-C-methyl-D-erythritol kinase n=1 Tax=Oricola cellulosilytica TaxID=1429082 RepID=A0A4R0PAU5_9HYPH|nr:4-(cytidine 5'-diphospho)-2-C-methyl-D-erythritol kinase [Oricola cellulosilytica]TCD13425.1 4-(cytidine 5'-diphospho)-2-C-methyl-D-erythritol kinase [Oricola cellulosilytica]